MKKLTLTIAILLGLGMTSFAEGGGLFNRANSAGSNTYFTEGREITDNSTPALPVHGSDQNQDAPLGSGIVLLTAMGAVYLVGKRRKED